MAEPENLTLKLLREMRAETATGFKDLRTEMNNRFDGVDERFEAQDKKLESIREALKTETMLGRYVTSGVEDRLDEIEKRLAAIETRS